MKTPLLLLALCACLFFSCKKSAVNTDQGFLGDWELVRYMGFPFPPALPAGNGYLLKLYKDRKVERYEAGVLAASGTFTFKRKKDCYGDNDMLIIFKFSSYQQEYYISIENEQLWLGSSTCLADAGAAVYRRI